MTNLGRAKRGWASRDSYANVGLWPFDGGRRARIRVELEELHERARAARESGDEQEIETVCTMLRDKALSAPDSIAFEMGSYQLLRELHELVERRRKERERAQSDAVLEQLRPCGCGGREYHLSNPVAIDELVSSTSSSRSPRVRIGVCASCGHVSLWALDLKELEWPLFDRKLVRAKGGEGGPFR